MKKQKYFGLKNIDKLCLLANFTHAQFEQMELQNAGGDNFHGRLS